MTGQINNSYEAIKTLIDLCRRKGDIAGFDVYPSNNTANHGDVWFNNDLAAFKIHGLYESLELSGRLHASKLVREISSKGFVFSAVVANEIELHSMDTVLKEFFTRQTTMQAHLLILSYFNSRNLPVLPVQANVDKIILERCLHLADLIGLPRFTAPGGIVTINSSQIKSLRGLPDNTHRLTLVNCRYLKTLKNLPSSVKVIALDGEYSGEYLSLFMRPRSNPIELEAFDNGDAPLIISVMLERYFKGELDRREAIARTFTALTKTRLNARSILFGQ